MDNKPLSLKEMKLQKRQEILSGLKQKMQGSKKQGAKNMIRLPSCMLAEAKEQGAVKSKEDYYWAVYSDDFENHPLYEYRVDNELWFKLTNPTPFEHKDELKALGMVIERNKDDVWESYVLGIEDYEDLLTILVEEGYV